MAAGQCEVEADVLNELVATDLRAWHAKLMADGSMLTHEKLEGYFHLFRERFGPDVLRSMDGPSLLEFMHNHGNTDSLVYWLEFKNDEEFPKQFGSIAGGSALKFGIYRRKETGSWMTGSPQQQRELSQDEAVQIARRHRDQLLRGADLIAHLPANATDEDYRALQNALGKEAPDVSDTAWGHKYFSLLFPEKLDDYHNQDYQRFHLVKLLEHPPAGIGRYIPASRFAAIARELGFTINQLTRITNNRHGGGHPHRYWRIGTSDGTQARNRWDLMKDGSCVAVGWPDLGNLSWVRFNQESREKLRTLMDEKYPGTPQQIGRKMYQVFHFVSKIAAGDYVIPMDGQTVLGVGRVLDDEYMFDTSSDFPHRRHVQWLSLEEWGLPEKAGLRTTVYELTGDMETGDYKNLVSIEEHVLKPGKPIDPPLRPLKNLDGIPGRIQAILERKAQVILYGPPGTGKTYWARIAAYELAAQATFGKSFAELSDAEKAEITGGSDPARGLVRMCCFHPSYGYEDFMEGYRPQHQDGTMSFVLRDGIFKTLCQEAAKQPGRKFYLIVDEVNRGDIPRIFGELLTVLERDKRGQPIVLPHSGSFTVPPNVYVIGTMNTADRSIALLDTALRRRFGFIEILPDYNLLSTAVIENVSLGALIKEINKAIRQFVGRDARNLQIGHAYFLDNGKALSDARAFAKVFRDDVIPLLEEYCYEDFTTLVKILGNDLVDSDAQMIRQDLFADGRQAELIQVLASNFPDLAVSKQQIEADAAPANEESEPLETDEDQG